MKTGLKRVLQAVFSLVFVIMTIGTGHLFMITAEHFDMKVSADEYTVPGREASLHGGVPVSEELEKMVRKSRSAGNSHEEKIYTEARNSLKKNGHFRFRMLPVSDFLVYCALCCALVTLGLLVFSRYVKHNAAQTVIGIFAGLLGWITVEFGLIMASRQLGIARRFDIINDNIVGIRGEHTLIKYSWVFLFLVLLYLLFQESVRCNMILFIRRRLRLMRGRVATGAIDNYAPRVAFFYTSSIWTFYVILLLAYDESIFGVRSWFTYLFFFICFSSTGYLFYRLIHQGGIGAMLRYSIGVALVFWSDIEILEKWGGVEGPWHRYHVVSVLVFISALVLGILFMVREVRRRRVPE